MVTKLGLWHLCVPHLAQGSLLQKRLQNVFLEICNAEIAVLTKIERQFSNKVILKLKLTINVFYKKCSPKWILFNEKNFKKIQTIFGLAN